MVFLKDHDYHKIFFFYNINFLNIYSSITLKLSANVFINDINLLTIYLSIENNYLNLAEGHKKYFK